MHRLIEISPPDILDKAWDRAVHSVVKRRVEYLPQPSSPGGSRASPIGGFLFCIPTNLPEERVELAADAIAWMTLREAMKAHVKNGFPIAPRFSVSADPEAAVSSPIVRFVDQLAKKNLLHTWQRPNIPQYTAIERIVGEEIHNALSGRKSDLAALDDAALQINRHLRSGSAQSTPMT